MNRMDRFLEQTMAYYLDLHNKHELMDGNELDRFTVFIDMDDCYLAYQIYYIDEAGETVILDFEPDKERFMVFYKAYLQVEVARKMANKSITFYEVIMEMESSFLKYAVAGGYREEIQFSLFYVPFFIDSSEPLVKKENPYSIPYELMLFTNDITFKN